MIHSNPGFTSDLIIGSYLARIVADGIIDLWHVINDVTSPNNITPSTARSATKITIKSHVTVLTPTTRSTISTTLVAIRATDTTTP
ncbi:MAG: hypothetical protein QF535_00395 [Anaerolineales bacterium]|jgi:hypothetical protein|nr:hypothetical protein [Anaerolineales bacterium]